MSSGESQVLLRELSPVKGKFDKDVEFRFIGTRKCL